MNNENIFNYKSYRAYLNDLSELKGRRSGVKAELASAMGSHPAYMSRVLGGTADLSLEQAEKITRYLQLDFDEKKYFLLLLEEERAATKELKSYFRHQLSELLQQRKVVQNRIPPSREISDEDRATYYSAWYYTAIHVAVSIPKYQEVSSLAGYLGLSVKTIRECLRLLEKMGLVQNKSGAWSVTERHIHIDRKSALFRQNHTNWHLRAIQSFDQDSVDSEVRYSGVFSLSVTDAEILREQLLRHIGEFLKRVAASPEETAYVYNFDFFPLGKE